MPRYLTTGLALALLSGCVPEGTTPVRPAPIAEVPRPPRCTAHDSVPAREFCSVDISSQIDNSVCGPNDGSCWVQIWKRTGAAIESTYVLAVSDEQPTGANRRNRSLLLGAREGTKWWLWVVSAARDWTTSRAYDSDYPSESSGTGVPEVEDVDAVLRGGGWPDMRDSVASCDDAWQRFTGQSSMPYSHVVHFCKQGTLECCPAFHRKLAPPSVRW
jgi:hypothetical protein